MRRFFAPLLTLFVLIGMVGLVYAAMPTNTTNNKAQDWPAYSKVGRHVSSIYVARGWAAGAPSYGHTVFVAPFKCRIHAIYITTDSVMTGADTNTFSWKLRNRGTDASGTAILGDSLNFVSGTNLPASVPYTLYQPTTLAEFARGTVVDLYRLLAGSGLVSPGVLVNVVYEAVE